MYGENLICINFVCIENFLLFSFFGIEMDVFVKLYRRRWVDV